MTYGHAAFLLVRDDWLAQCYRDIENHTKEKSMEMTETMTETPAPAADDFLMDARRYFEHREQSACNLREGDKVYHNDALVVVTKIKRRRERAGETWDVSLSDGHTFDPRPEMAWDEESRNALGRLTFWRPRAAFANARRP